MKIAFIGFQHGHMYSLYNKCKAHAGVEIFGSYEELEEYQIAAKKEGVDLSHKDYKDLINSPEVDAIAIGVNYGSRGKLAIEALKAGKHIIADKPLCTNIGELVEIERLSRQKGLKVGLMLDLRYMGVAKIAKEIIESGRLGRVHAVNFGGQHNLNYPNRASWYFEQGLHGGTINDIAIHGLDLISYLLDKNVKSIYAARCWNAFATEVPHFKDAAQLMLELDDGVGVIGDVSYSSPKGLGFSIPQYWRFSIWGTGGLIEFNYKSNELWAAFAGAKEPEVFVAEENTETDYLTDFLADIKGNPTAFDSKRNIDSTKALLKIQQFADKDLYLRREF